LLSFSSSIAFAFSVNIPSNASCVLSNPSWNLTVLSLQNNFQFNPFVYNNVEARYDDNMDSTVSNCDFTCTNVDDSPAHGQMD
jgi:hypothetical protein